MKKPNLADYQLSEDDIKTYETQKEKYNIAKQKHIEKVKVRIKFALVIIPIIIILMTIFFELSNEYRLLIGFTCFFVILSGVTAEIILIDQIRDFPGSNYKNEELYNTYISSFLDIKISAYNSALKEYTELNDRMHRDFWLNLNGYSFETEIAKLYERLGYSAQITPKSGDGGVDIILEKDGKRIAVQCKHHSKPVGPAPVRELLGVVASQDFDSGIFISLNGYTKNAISEANLSKVQISLLSLYDILALLKNQSSTYDSIGINDDSYVEEDKKKSGIIAVPTNIPIYENLKNEINIKDNDYLLQYKENFDKILEYIKNHEPFDYGSSTTPEEDKENAELFKHSSDYLPEKYKMEFFTYVDFEIIVYKNSYSFEPVYIEIHHFPNCDERRIFNYFLKKYDLILDYTINRIKGVSDEELILRANYISECISIYPQKNIDPSYWFSKSRNDLKTYIESFSFMQTGNDKKPSANAIKHCLDNCSTCNRDTCILDDSK